MAEERALFGLAPVPPDQTVRYGEHPDQLVDLHLPPAGAPAGPGPLVVLLHGGFWRQAYDRTHLTPCAAELARHGLPVALAEYRRVGGAGGWPVTCQDVAALVSAVRRHPVADGRPLVLVGHSAGGHLALWAAAQPSAGKVRVVAVAPVADLALAHRLGLGGGAVADLLGGPERVAERLPQADPARLLPLRNPVTILHGTADPDVPLAVSERYVAVAREAREAAPGGPEPELRVLDGVGHFAPLTPGAPAFRTLLAAIRG
ncbi:lipase [Streptomyces albus subsp. albus]|nr:lipase [Streptomyces albus subsp. albus]